MAEAVQFGSIHPRQRVVPFSLGKHGKTLATLLALTVCPIVLFGKYFNHATPDITHPAVALVLQKTKRMQMAAERKGRLVFASANLTPKLDLIERRMDGSLEEAVYFNAQIDLSKPVIRPQVASLPAAPASLSVAYQNVDPQNPGPFSLILHDDGGFHDAALKPARRVEPQPVRGEPENVSIAVPQPAPVLKHLVSMPLEKLALRDIEGATGVSAQEWDDLAKALGTDSVRSGEKLELILGTASARNVEGERSAIIFARFHARGHERLIGRLDNGRFGDMPDHAVYERLVAEAMAQENQRVEAKIMAQAANSPAVRQGMRQFPKLFDHLRGEKVPGDIGVQVLQLLRANGFHVANDNDLPNQLKLVFRADDNGKAELVYLSCEKDGHEKRFYRYKRTREGKPEFFDEAGRSATKVLMHNPVPGSRMGDGFAWRIHPILKERKFHNGVDFDAPLGSPILAAGDGVVTQVSEEKGYGKFVRIRHDFGYTTTYAHISGTPKGLKVGDRVAQGQTIAYVGSTGYSTGPHLYYELRVGGAYEDPTKTDMQAGTILHGEELDEFHRQRAHLQDITGAIGNTLRSAADKVEDILR